MAYVSATSFQQLGRELWICVGIHEPNDLTDCRFCTGFLRPLLDSPAPSAHLIRSDGIRSEPVQLVEQLVQLLLVWTAPRDSHDALQLAERWKGQLHAIPSARTSVDTMASRPAAMQVPER